MLRVEATGDAPRWAAEHRDALRAAVVERGSLLVRGLRLRDAAEVEAVFRQLGTFAFAEMLLFLLVLLVGLAYAWRKGALEWV